MKAEPFTVSVPDATLADLRDRLGRTRWPDQIPGVGWDYGTDGEYLKQLVAYWRDGFDWRAQERRINSFEHYRAEVEGVGIHFLRAPARGGRAVPLVLLHGWPASFVQMLDIVPLLADPAGHGAGTDAVSFDVIVPSLPGYGFSDIPTERGMSPNRAADLVAGLMTDVLGYQRFAARGSDLGAETLTQLARKHPERLIGLHLTGVKPVVPMVPDDMSPAEAEFVNNVQMWTMTESAYAMMHLTKPQTLAPALNDSPAGLASWIVEKFRRWSDCDGDLESRFSMDELLTNLTVYWATDTITSSMRFYLEMAHDPGGQSRVEVPVAVLMASHDMVPAPREWMERTYAVARWTQTHRGGHFLEWEEPELVAQDVREFFGGLPN